jgi:hypothetical protein
MSHLKFFGNAKSPDGSFQELENIIYYGRTNLFQYNPRGRQASGPNPKTAKHSELKPIPSLLSVLGKNHFLMQQNWAFHPK